MNGININVTITSPDLHDAFLAIAEVLGSMLKQGRAPTVPAEDPAPVKVEKPRAVKPAPVKVEVPVVADTLTIEEPQATFTLEDVRKLSMERSKKDKAAVKAAITAVGATKVTDIDAAKYPEYVTLLEAI